MRVMMLLLVGLLCTTVTTYAQRAESPWYAVDPGARVRIQVAGNLTEGTFSGVRNEGVVIITQDSMRVYGQQQIEAAWIGRPQSWPTAETAFLFGALGGGVIAALTSDEPAVTGPRVGVISGFAAGVLGYIWGKHRIRFTPMPLR